MSTDASPGRTRARRNWAALAVGVLAALLLWFAASGEVPREVGERVGTAAPAEAGTDAGAPGRSRTRARAAASEESAALAPSPESAPPQPASSAWRFTVVADEDGAPIVGATISEGESGSAKALGTTGAEGTLDLGAVPAGRVQASAPGRVTVATHVAQLGFAGQRQYEFRLLRGGVVRGRVETPDGAPAPAVGVQLCTGRSTTWSELVTDAAGRFEFPIPWELGRCGYVVAGRTTRAWRPSGTPLGAPGTSAPFRLTVERPAIDLVVRLERPAVLVLDAVLADGTPAVGPIDFRITRAGSGESARRQVPHVELTVHPGLLFVHAATAGGLSDHVVVNVGPGERVARVLTLQPATARISGVVLRADGTPRAGTRLSWVDHPGRELELSASSFMSEMLTDEAGRFAADGLRPGRCVLRVETDGSELARKVEITAPAEDVVVGPLPTAKIRFVVNAADGAAVPATAYVQWAPDGDERFGSNRTLAANQGEVMTAVPAGRVSLHVRAGKVVVYEREVTLAAGETADLGTFTVGPERIVAGRVVGPDGRPAPPLTYVGAYVMRGRSSTLLEGVRTLTADGTFELRVPDTDGIHLAAQVPGSAGCLVPVPRGRDVRGIELRLVRGGLIRLRTWRRDGGPSGDARWRVEPAVQDGFRDVDADGVSTVRREPGAARVIVRNDRGHEVATRDVVVTDGATTDVDVTLPE